MAQIAVECLRYLHAKCGYGAERVSLELLQRRDRVTAALAPLAVVPARLRGGGRGLVPWGSLIYDEAEDEDAEDFIALFTTTYFIRPPINNTFCVPRAFRPFKELLLALGVPLPDNLAERIRITAPSHERLLRTGALRKLRLANHGDPEKLRDSLADVHYEVEKKCAIYL
eukprot:tig00000057_g45.t1